MSEVSGLGYGRVGSEWLKHSFFKDSGLAQNEILEFAVIHLDLPTRDPPKKIDL